MKTYLFFDTASTTKCSPAAAAAWAKFSLEEYGNPSSAHILGRASADAIRKAREFFAQAFRVEPSQVIFTGSGTEANNLALQGILLASHAPDRRLIISAGEHPAISQTADALKVFNIDTDTLAISREGQPSQKDLLAALTPFTTLISLQAVNNVTGALLPVGELAAQAKARQPDVLFHTDAIQAFGRLPISSFRTGVDLLSISGHKLNGPKGIGALIVLNSTLLPRRLRPLVHGGGQENGFRSGTASAALIVAFHIAAEEALRQQTQSFERILELNRVLRERLTPLLSERPGKPILTWNSPAAPDRAIPHIVNLSAPGIPSGAFAGHLEDQGLIVATGAACDSRTNARARSLLSQMGFSDEVSASSIRISFGPEHDVHAVDQLAAAIQNSVTTLRRLRGLR